MTNAIAWIGGMVIEFTWLGWGMRNPSLHMKLFIGSLTALGLILTIPPAIISFFAGP